MPPPATKTKARTPRAAPPPAPPAAEKHTKVLQQFRVVFNAVKTHFQQVERKAGVGGSQLWALSVINDQPGIGVMDLASALNVRQPTASILVRNLAQQGLVDARREGADRRSVQLHITVEGTKVLRRAPGPLAGVLPNALQALQPATLELLDQGLSELITILGANDRAATTPLSDLGMSGFKDK